MYRVLDDITIMGSGKRIPKGTVSALDEITEESLRILLAKGVIAKIAPPPLEVLPGWEHRAARLEEAGVKDAEALVAHDDTELAKQVGVRPSTIKRWKREAESFLTVAKET